MNPVEEIRRKLVRHPELRYVVTASSIEVQAPNADGFAVSLFMSDVEYVVYFEGWHEHFHSPEEALNCFAFGFSGEARLAIAYRGSVPVKWTLESLRDGQWCEDSTTGLLVTPFWRRPRIIYRQNPNLLAAAV